MLLIVNYAWHGENIEPPSIWISRRINYQRRHEAVRRSPKVHESKANAHEICSYIYKYPKKPAVK